MFEKSFPQSPANCDAHLAESLFQTRSRTQKGTHGDRDINQTTVPALVVYLAISDIQ
ncbi:MAG: DUF6783 domain-containing protein [Ruminococcus sp.]